MPNLDAIFSPQSVAVVGASTTPGKVGHDIFANILKGGYKGILYPVNPNAKSVLSVRAYPNILDIPDDVDLAIIILSPRVALKAIKEAIKKGVKGIVIVSAGFREVGGEGLEIENQIVSICKKAGVRVVGPNCLGVINPLSSVSLNASFSRRMPKSGNISFISQSGALCTAVLDFAADRDFGFSKFISIGNKADVDELDLLRYMHDDKDTEVIMIYLEELKKGLEFVDSVKEITSGDRPTPILVIKSGRTTAGARAAASHTGALAGSEAVYDAIFKQAGIIRVDSIDELFDYAIAFAYKNKSETGKFTRKVPSGNRVAIVTNAGGPGIVATDMTVSSGLKLAKFHEETIEALESHLPLTANLYNPVDIIGDAAQDRYENALSSVIKDENVDGALVILTPQSMTNALGTAEAIVRIDRRTHKPILCCFMGIFDVSSGVKYLQEHGMPVFKFPENTAKAFGALYRYSNWLNRQHLAQFTLKHNKERAAEIIENSLAAGKTYLSELDGIELLKCYGFNVLPAQIAKNENEAAQLAENMTFPVAMKIISPQIQHKSDASGVILQLDSKEKVKQAFQKLIERAKQFNPNVVIEGVLVQKMSQPGDEVILGVNRYPAFGPLLMAGLGGIYVELFKDVVFRLAPIGRNETRRMIKSIKGYNIFKGFRGRPESDIKALEKSVVSLSDMVTNHPEIIEMDINPLMVHEKGKGVTVADYRIILKALDNNSTAQS
ncbi:MAG: acetate--CoA ligase family protein [Deltaproteobacteria bacterium]|nr:acetate--CoA ligase family protein [Deltaproteobacteria bacterium]MBW2166216.1 acetate--CoA ligase family protein [Deltaproteobacteria bacterium]